MTQINLLPRRKRLGEAMSARAWGYLFAGIALVSVAGVVILMVGGSEETPSVVEEVEPTEEAAVEETMEEVELPEEVALEAEEAPIAEIVERRRVRMEMFDRIQEAIPPFVWLTSISATSTDEVLVQGIAFSPIRIQEFAQRLGIAEASQVRKSSFEGRDVSKFSLAGRLPRRAAQAQPPPFISPDARKRTIEAILRKGKPLNLKIARGPEQMPMEPPAIRQRFTLRGEAPYDQLRTFMHYLAGLPDAVSVFRIVITAEAAMRTETSTVGAIFTLDLYMRPE